MPRRVLLVSRIKNTCLKLVDRNTKFFHQAAITRRRRAIITQLKKQNGYWTEDPKELQELTREFYKNLYSTDLPQPVDT